jgi:hypothetical protein
MGDKSTVHGKTSGSKNHNSAWFPTALRIAKSGEISIHLAVEASCPIEYSLDNGTNWVKYNSGLSLPAVCGDERFMSVVEGDELNLRQTSGASVTVTFCRVQQ